MHVSVLMDCGAGERSPETCRTTRQIPTVRLSKEGDWQPPGFKAPAPTTLIRGEEGSTEMLTETIIFMQGDDANEALDMLYVDGWTTAESVAKTMAHLAQWDYGEPTEAHETEPAADHVREGPYLMQWHYGLGWISLDRVHADYPHEAGTLYDCPACGL